MFNIRHTSFYGSFRHPQEIVRLPLHVSITGCDSNPITESCCRDEIMLSGSLGRTKNEFSVIACSQTKDVVYTDFDA